LQIVTVKEIEKERNRRYDTSDRYTSLFIGLLIYMIYMQAHTMIVSRLTYRYCCFLLSLVLATKTGEMYEYLY